MKYGPLLVTDNAYKRYTLSKPFLVLKDEEENVRGTVHMNGADYVSHPSLKGY